MYFRLSPHWCSCTLQVETQQTSQPEVGQGSQELAELTQSLKKKAKKAGSAGRTAVADPVSKYLAVPKRAEEGTAKRIGEGKAKRKSKAGNA